jgi:hypothetical protein
MKERIILVINIILGLVLLPFFTEDSFSQARTNLDTLRFSEPLNLTNNTRDSVYAQVASDEKNVYVVWQENTPRSNGESVNYDIFMKKSTDGGLTFGKEINLSNNPGFSEHPQIATSGNNVYIAWIDNSPSTDSSPEAMVKNKKIMFKKSTDNGITFGETNTLSNVHGSDSFNQEIAATGDNVYVVWQTTPLPSLERDVGSTLGANSDAISVNSNRFDSSISFISSSDNGETFDKVRTLDDHAFKSYPKVAAYENKVYVIWNVGIIGESASQENGNNNKNNNSSKNNGVFLTKSFDGGRSFDSILKLNHDSESVGESQVAAYGNNVYAVWGGNPDEKVAGNLFYTRSSDNGTSFIPARPLTDRDTLNVEVAAENNSVFIAWQGVLPNGNEEIYIKRSSDAGDTFPNPTENISKNSGISECTSIVISGGREGVYLTWEDSPAGNHEILFARNI